MHKPLEMRIIDRLFDRFEARWLNQWTDKFRGINIGNVKDEWAEDLGGFAGNLDALGYAFNVVKDSTFPPNLPEFKSAARRAPPKSVQLLECKLTPDQIERNKQRVAEMIAGLMKAKSL